MDQRLEQACVVQEYTGHDGARSDSTTRPGLTLTGVGLASALG